MSASELNELMAQLQELWQCLDELLEMIPASKWSGKFGKEWEYADIPRHLAYFDQTIIAESIACGASMPLEKQTFMETHRQFNEWNQRMLTAYRCNPSFEFALFQMRESRRAICAAIMTSETKDLDQPAWIPLTGFAGWRTMRFALNLCRQHTWTHFMQLRLRLKQNTPIPSPRISHAALNSIVCALPAVINQHLVRRTQLNTQLILSGPAGGCWLISVAAGDCHVTKTDRDENIDLKLTLTPETLIGILSQMHSLLAVLICGGIQISGWQYVPVFLLLFGRPHPDQRLIPVS